MNSEQTISDGVQDGVEEAKNKKNVSQWVGNGLLQVVREKPVPQAQEVVRCPAHNKGRHNDNAHF